MNCFLFFICLFIFANNLFSQTCCTPQEACNLRSISVGSGNASSITLSHVGPASIQPVAGQQVNWIFGTTANPNLSNVITSATNGVFTFNLTTLGISTSDIIVATCIITSTSGSVCTINNQNIVWTLVAGPPFNIFQWKVTSPPVNGVFQGPLPVEWLSFSGENSNGDVNLNWSTASEVNNKGYEVLVSSDNKSWKTIGFINGKGNTYLNSYYNFVHKNAPNHLLYYKLIQVDYDGKTDESEIITINNFNSEVALDYFKIYPNPSNGKATLDIGSAPINSLNISIFNSIGQLIVSKSQKDINNSIQTLDISDKGLYIIHINKDGKQLIKRFLVE